MEPGNAHGGEESVKPIRLNEAEMKQFGIEISPAGAGSVSTNLTLSGEISANEDRLAHVVPPIRGVVREVRKNLGDTVKQGEVMAILDSRELADAKAEYLSAREKVILAQAKYSREEGLWKKKISAEQEYLEARQELAEARINLRSSEQKLHALGFSHGVLDRLPHQPDELFTRYEITAPLDGTVIEKHITRGEVLKDDSEAFVVADLSTVWVNLNVYQKDLSAVRKGQKVEITTGHDSRRASGEIAYVGQRVKEETRTALARVVLPNSREEWRPGMFITGRLALSDAAAPVVIPKSALQTVEDRTVVFVETPEGFETRPVMLGQTTEDQVEVVSGLTSGERCVVKGAFTLKAQLSKGAFGDGHAH